MAADPAPLLDLHRAPNGMRSRRAETGIFDHIQGSNAITFDESATVEEIRQGAMEEFERSNI